MKTSLKAFAAATVLLAASQLAAHAEDAPAATPAAPAAIQATPAQSAPTQTPDETKPTYAARPAPVSQNADATADATTEPARHHRHYARHGHYWRHYAYWEPFPIFFPHLYHSRIVWNRVRWF